MKIGDQLQKQRKLHNMSQDALASKLNISRQSISKWENGTALPSFSRVIAISELFDISLDELIKGDAELMEKMEKTGFKERKTGIIVFSSFFIAAIIMTIMKYFSVSVDSIVGPLSVAQLIAFFGLAVSINWRRINKVLDKKVVIWGILWLSLYLIPALNDEIAGFSAGFSGH